MKKLLLSLWDKILFVLSKLKGLKLKNAESKIFVTCLLIALVSSQLLNVDWHPMIKTIIEITNKTSIAIIAGIIFRKATST